MDRVFDPWISTNGYPPTRGAGMDIIFDPWIPGIY